MSDIKLLVPDMPSARKIEPYLYQIDDSRQYSNRGPLVRELERRLRKHHFLGRHVTMTASGTAGLTVALAQLQLSQGARVLIPNFTFIATACAVRAAGYEPVLGDVDPKTWLLTPETAEKAGCAAVVPVAALGNPVNEREWENFSQKTGVPVVIDACPAFGNQHGSKSLTLVFSLHATKSLGCGEGGFILTPDYWRKYQHEQLSNFGLDGMSPGAMAGGINAKMSEYAAAVGLAALDRWDVTARSLRALWRQFCFMMPVSLGTQDRAPDGVYATAPLIVPNAAEAVGKLKRAGIESRRYYLPLIMDHPPFRHCERVGNMDVSRWLAEKMVCVPFHTGMRTAQFKQIFEELTVRD